MSRLAVWANILAGVFVWLVVTAVPFFWLTWWSDDPAAGPAPLWPRIVLLIFSATTYALYVRHYWKKLAD